MEFGGNNKQKTIFMMKEQLIREIEEIRKAQSDLRLRLNAVEDQVGRLPSQQLDIGVSHRISYFGVSHRIFGIRDSD